MKRNIKEQLFFKKEENICFGNGEFYLTFTDEIFRSNSAEETISLFGESPGEGVFSYPNKII